MVSGHSFLLNSVQKWPGEFSTTLIVWQMFTSSRLWLAQGLYLRLESKIQWQLQIQLKIFFEESWNFLLWLFTAEQIYLLEIQFFEFAFYCLTEFFQATW